MSSVFLQNVFGFTQICCRCFQKILKPFQGENIFVFIFMEIHDPINEKDQQTPKSEGLILQLSNSTDIFWTFSDFEQKKSKNIFGEKRN
jgi:hypothetical protein